MLVNPAFGTRVTNDSNYRPAVVSINGSSRSERETNRIDLYSTGAASARHHATDNPMSVNPTSGTNTNDFNHRLAVAANNILDESNTRGTNNFNHRLAVAANNILDESNTNYTQRRQAKRRCNQNTPSNRYPNQNTPLNRLGLGQYMDPESVSSTSSSGSDNISAAEPYPQFIDLIDYHALNDPRGWNSHLQSQSSSVGNRHEDWNPVPQHTLPPLSLLDITGLPEGILKVITCPLTLQPLTDPVVGGDGHTYKRVWIEKHLEKDQISPINRQSMSLNILVSDKVIRDIIED